MLVKLLRIFAQVWAYLVFILFILSLAFTWYMDGFAKVQEIMNPFNVINYLVTIIVLSPAIVAWTLSDYLTKKTNDKNNSNVT